MKLRFPVALLLVSTLWMTGASSCNRKVELTLFHTNDIHSHMKASKIDPFGLGGLARISTLLKSKRQSAGLSMTLDGGDFSEGSWYFSVDAGANMLRIMGAMGYDAAALGNHDFLEGPDGMIEMIKEAPGAPAVLAANIETATYPKPAEFRQAIPPTMIKKVGDLKVGLIGLTTYEFVYDSYVSPMKLGDPVTSATKAALELRPQVDVLILMSHNNFEVNKQLARAIPGLDAVISGHSHVKIPRAVMVQNAGKDVPVVETGCWGRYLGELKLEVDMDAKFATFKSYKLTPVTPDIAEDPAIAQMVAAEDAKLNQKFGDNIDRVVAESEIDLIQSDSYESPLGNLAVKAYRAATGADLAMEEISLTGVSVAKGDATLFDLHDVIPHIYNPASGKEWTVRVWNAKGSDLATVFNTFYTISGLLPFSSPLGWVSAENVLMTWDPSQTVPLIRSIKIGDSMIQPGNRYAVALSQGFLEAIQKASEKLGLGIDLSQTRDTGVEVWKAVVNYAASGDKLTQANLRVGGHVNSVHPDLAIFYYGMSWDGNQLSVEVENQGIETSGAGSISCSHGVPNDLTVYDTTDQQWTTIGTAVVPALQLNQKATIQIPWDRSRLSPNGFWPVRCELSVNGDSYPTNNKASKVFVVGQR